MKLSEMNFDQMGDAACKLIDPIGRILDTPDLITTMESLSKGAVEGESPMAYVLRAVKAALPALLKTRRDELLEILAVLADTSKAKLRKASGLKVMAMIYEYIIKDAQAIKDALFNEYFFKGVPALADETAE